MIQISYYKMPLSLFPVLCINAVKKPIKARLSIVTNIYVARIATHLSLLSAVKSGILT